jgi:hypothetical protein
MMFGDEKRRSAEAEIESRMALIGRTDAPNHSSQ